MPTIIRRLLAILLLPFMKVIVAPERLCASISQIDRGWGGTPPADSQSDWVGTEPAEFQIDWVDTAPADRVSPEPVPVAFAILFWVTPVALLAGAIYLPYRWKKQRRLGMQALAEQLGWNWMAEPPYGAMEAYRRLDSFVTGKHHEIRNYLTGHRGGYTVAVFDLKYFTGAGDRRRVWKQTVVHLRSPALRLPLFTIQPEKKWHRILAMFGYEDIDFDEDFEFSFGYLLRGPDPSAVRLMMGSNARDFYRDNPGSCSEGRGRDLFFWQPVGTLRPHAVDAQVDLAIHLAHCLGTGPVPPGDRRGAEPGTPTG